MDSSCIITQVTRPPDSDSPSPDANGGLDASSGNNNSLLLPSSSSSAAAPSSPSSGHKGKSRHRAFLETMDSLLCCFRSKGSRSGVSGGSGGSVARSEATVAVNAEADDFFLTPKLQGKCLLPTLKAGDPAQHRMCLVIDLDETLVHSSFKPISNPDFIVPVEIDGTIHQVYVLKRPFVDEFLQRVGQLYECVLFTASLAKYADPVADLLDKWGVFRARLFRESCVFYRGNYVKDLGRLGRDLHRVVIVDNSPASYIFHPDNAVPVASWFDNVHDTELRDLIPFFEKLSRVENIYTVLRNANHVSPSSTATSLAGFSVSPATPASSSAAVAVAAAAAQLQGTPTSPAAFANHLPLNSSSPVTSTPSATTTAAGRSDHMMLQQMHPPPVTEAPASPGSVIHSSPSHSPAQVAPSQSVTQTV